MAYRKPIELDGFIEMMPKADMRVKALIAEDLVTFLSDETNSIVCMDMGLLIDGLMPWLTGSHFKIAQKSLEAFTELIKRLGPDFNAYTSTVLPHVIDRLGDSKDTVREKAQLLLQTLMEYKVQTPQAIVDKLAASCFKHKNGKVREEFLQTIVNTLNEHGTNQLTVRMYIKPICSLLSDPTSTVRDAANQTLVEIYKHVGERLRPDLRRLDDLPSSKLAILEQKFDQIKSEGLLLPTASLTTQNSNNGHDEGDNVQRTLDRPSRIVKRTVSASLRGQKVPSAFGSTESGVSVDAGAVTMDIFESSFENVPQLTIFHAKDMDDIYRNILQIISDKNSDWEKRVDALKKIRSLFIVNFHVQPQIAVQLKEMSIAFLDILKEELRSQVIREACITIAYMAKVLRLKFDIFSAYILEQLINLIQNSAKVIASASNIALKYIIQYNHSPKLLKIITDTLHQSKSKDIRAALCEIMVLLFEEWQTKSLEKHAVALRDTLKKSLSDADNDARRHSRRAYWLFRKHFPEHADAIYTTLDIAAQRALEKERNGGLSGTTAIEERRTMTSGMRIQRSPGSMQKPAAGMRSVSAVDAAAAQRAKARAQFAVYSRKKISANNAIASNAVGTANTGGTTGSLPRPRAVGGAISSAQMQMTSGITPRTRGRTGVSQSQPGSRSTSPSAKLREQQMHAQGYYRPLHTGTIPKKASGIPRSLASSRETSPTRGGGSNSLMKRSVYNTASSSRRTPDRATPTRPLAAARILQQSREAENALADALSPEAVPADLNYSLGDYTRGNSRFNRRLLSRDESDDSEASSVCSERSFDSSFARNNSSYSLSGSRNRLDWSGGQQRAPIEDIDTIIQYCGSTHWAERKDGLISLTQYLVDGKLLNRAQLNCVLEMFRKMFMDTHTKVYSLFLDTVAELILAHGPDLHDWLFILLTRLFNKLGTELLNSMHTKIWNTLKTVKECFPTDLQLKNVFRILSDSAQTPGPKTKVAILLFLSRLATMYCKSSDFPAEDTQGTVSKAITKIIQQAGDQKSHDLRTEARRCLAALYNLNMHQMINIISALPRNLNELATNIIQAHHIRKSTSGTNSPSSSPLSSSSPKPLQSPSLGPFSSLQPQYDSSPRSRQPEHDALLHQNYSDASMMDVQHNIHKTSEEIRNCFGTLDISAGSAANNFQTTNSSTTSGRTYHTMAQANGYNGHLTPQDSQQLDSSSNSKTQSATTTESNTPESTTMRLDGNPLLDNHHISSKSVAVVAPNTAHSNAHHTASQKTYQQYTTAMDGSLIFENTIYESDVVRFVCGLATTDLPANGNTDPEVMAQTIKNLTLLGVAIKVGNCVLPNRNFRGIMKILLHLLDQPNVDLNIEAVHVLGKILRSDKMQENWINFLELILLKIVNCYQNSKEMAREIDMIIPRIVPSLPLNATINIVNPVIATGSYPLNLCAVKILTELAERKGSEMTEHDLDTVFPHLARLTDDLQSMVRKAAVFCIVKLYIVVGEEKIKPKLSMLNPSKIRLLNVYIEKQRNSITSGGGASTKNSSTSSS